MDNTKEIALKRAIGLLYASGAQFKVIAEDGTEFGDLKVASIEEDKPKKRTRTLKYPYGSIAAHYKPYLLDMKVGDVAKIPYGEFDADTLHSAVAAHCSQFWGRKTYISTARHDDKIVEILRVE
jgi:hypothetical protein